MRVAILILLVGLLGGCAGFGNKEVIEAMKGDTSTNCMKVLTPWGSATYLRANPVAGKVVCDGMTLETTSPVKGGFTFNP